MTENMNPSLGQDNAYDETYPPFQEVSVADDAYDEAPMLGQNIDTQSPEQGKMSQQSPPVSVPQETKSPTNARCWNLAYYQPYFDVNTATEIARLKKSLLPFGGDTQFFSEEEKPDLYGPFWIVSTLAFLMAAMSNLSRFLNDKSSDPQQWNSDIKKISQASTFLYCGIVVVPSVYYVILRNWGCPRNLIELISLYGYSLTVFLVACVLCVVRFQGVKWAVIGASFFISTLFLVRNVYGVIPAEKKQKPGYYVLGLTVCVQLGLSLALKLYFFRY